MSDELRYRRGRGQGERIVDVVGPTLPQRSRVPAPSPRAVAAGSAPPPMAQGSQPDLRPPPPWLEPVELGDLAAPETASGTIVIFGGSAILVERVGDRIALSLPGGIRLTGTAAEAIRLARLLASR